MKNFFLTLLIPATVLSASANSETNKYISKTPKQPKESINTLTKKEKADGWQLLFDGTSKKGWHVWHNKSDGSAWKVEDGVITLDASNKENWQTRGGGDLVTDESFENYHFSLEWKIAPNGNSGIIFNINEDPKFDHTWFTGMEMQIVDNDGHPDGKIFKHQAGDLYDLFPCSKKTVKAVGEWNKAEIVKKGDQLDLYLNGEKVVSTKVGDENWKKVIAGSKFKDMADFATFKSGHIAIQDHGDRVSFRNIKVKKF